MFSGKRLPIFSITLLLSLLTQNIFPTNARWKSYHPSYAYKEQIGSSIDGGLCLDGSYPIYYYREGTSNHKYHISFEGGGWCGYTSTAGEGCTDSCYHRSKTQFGTTIHDNDTLDINTLVGNTNIAGSGLGYLSDNQTINPMMYNWNLVVVRYCDGGSFSGNLNHPIIVNNTKLYYRGWRILNDLINNLNINHGLANATDVVISGKFVNYYLYLL